LLHGRHPPRRREGVWCSEGLLVLLTRGLGGTVSVTITPALFPEQLLCGGQGALEFWNGDNRVRRGVRRRGSRGSRNLRWQQRAAWGHIVHVPMLPKRFRLVYKINDPFPQGIIRLSALGV